MPARSRPARGRRARSTSSCRPGRTRSRFRSPASAPRACTSTSRRARPPHHFRLLSDGLLGYAWPKWVKAGRKVRVPGPFRRALSTESLAVRDQEGARSAASAGSTSTARGPRCRSRPTAITPRPASPGTSTAMPTRTCTSMSKPPSGPDCTTSTPERPRGRSSPFPGSSRRRSRRRTIAVLASNITWNAYNNFGGRSNYINPDRLPATPTVNARLELKRYTDPDAVTYDTDDYAPLSFDRPEPINHIDAAHRDHRPDRGPGRLPHRAGRMAAPGLARAREFRLRLLRRDPAPRRHARPGCLQSLDHLHPSGILVADDVSCGQVVGSRARRQAHVPGRKRAELRGRVRRSHHGDLSQRRRPSHEKRRI